MWLMVGWEWVKKGVGWFVQSPQPTHPYIQFCTFIFKDIEPYGHSRAHCWKHNYSSHVRSYSVPIFVQQNYYCNFVYCKT